MGLFSSSPPPKPPHSPDGMQQQAPPAPASPEVAAPGTAFKGIRTVLLGPPGAGKGAQADRLAKKYASCHLTTAELLHSEMKSDSPLGQKIRKLTMDQQQPVDDDLMMELINKNLATDECRNGYIFDDFPHNREQAQKLDKLLEDHRAPLQAAVEFAVKGQEQPETSALINYYSKRGLHTAIDVSGQSGEQVEQQLDKLFAKMAQPKKRFLFF